jgi:hypothetical protein
MFGRVDAQLRTFSSFVSGVVAHPRPGPRLRRPGSQQLPTDYLMEVVGPGGQLHVAPGSRQGISPPALTAAQLHGPATPFTAAAKGSAGHSWRVLVRSAPGGRHVVAAFSLDDVQSTVGQLELADTVAGVAAIVLLVTSGSR